MSSTNGARPIAAGEIELALVELVIENELRCHATQRTVAMTYCLGMRSSWPTDWERVNRAIMARWPRGLDRVKKLAWAMHLGKTPFASKVPRPPRRNKARSKRKGPAR